MEEVRELRVQCLHRHSHTNRTLDSLNDVDRPPKLFRQVQANWWIYSATPYSVTNTLPD